MSVAITRLNMSAAELRREAARLKDAKAARRLLAIALVLEGSDRTHAAETCGMDRQTLRDWVHRYNAEGVEGLCNRKSAGRTPLLGPEEKAKIAALVEAGPDPDRDGVVRWRRIDLKRKIEDLFGVTMHERTVGKLLAALTERSQQEDLRAHRDVAQRADRWRTSLCVSRRHRDEADMGRLGAQCLVAGGDRRQPGRFS